MKRYVLAEKVSVYFLISTLLLSVLTCLPGSSFATEETPSQIAARLQAKYTTIKSLTFEFTQKTSGRLTGRSADGSGTAYFLKTGKQAKMLWNYTSPDKQVILSDGKTLSMYFSKQKQMIITPATSLQQDITYSFFSGAGSLKDDFLVLPPDPEVGENQQGQNTVKIIQLTPRTPQTQVKSILVWVTASSLIKRLEIRDYFDTLTVLNFTNIRLNSLVGENQQKLDNLFSFTPPKGTEIIRQ